MEIEILESDENSMKEKEKVIANKEKVKAERNKNRKKNRNRKDIWKQLLTLKINTIGRGQRRIYKRNLII